MKSIRAKLIFWICVLFIFIGALIYFPLSNILPQKITSQILKRDAEIAKFLSNEAKDLLLLNDRIALSLLLHDNLNTLEDAQYFFIQAPDGNIISHTFTEGFPKRLLSFRPDSRRPYGVKKFLNGGRKVYDIAVPILKGQMGTLHLGVSLESGKKDIAEITKINYYVAGIVLIGLGIGIFVFLIIGFLYSNQIIKLKNFAAKIGKGDLETKIDIKSQDEIGALASTFNEMLLHLKEKIQEVKRLNIVEERNRIAIELHDCCAQDLANIIKRLELCEKLFNINPSRAFEELEDLRKNTKDILDRTRQVIFGLKSPEDADFNLINKLNSYIKNYKRQNDIDVELNIATSMNDILPERAKSIFYIIIEALTNIKKHSAARNVKMNLKADKSNNLMINIKDDGKGFDINDTLSNISDCGKLGLISMRERTNSLNGKIAFESQPQKGTEVFIDIPLSGANLR